MIKVKACRIEFNFSSDSDGQPSTNQDDTKSLIGADPSDSETFYNDQILRQLFLDFKVKSEEGRSVLQYICWPLLNICFCSTIFAISIHCGRGENVGKTAPYYNFIRIVSGQLGFNGFSGGSTLSFREMRI